MKKVVNGKFDNSHRRLYVRREMYPTLTDKQLVLNWNRRKRKTNTKGNERSKKDKTLY